MMRIVNDLGDVQYAWLEGEALDASCRGMRFRLTVGTEGGIVCDVVTGPRDMTTEQVERLATHAVTNTDPLEDPLPISDDNGRPARIVADPVHVQPVSRIIRIGPADAPRKPKEVRVVNPFAAMAIMGGIMAAMSGLDWLGFPLAVGGAFFLIRRTKVLPALTEAYNVNARRER